MYRNILGYRISGTLHFVLLTTLMCLICVAANAATTSTIDSVTYNAETGEVVITGSALRTSQLFDLSTLTFSGESGERYMLQDVNDPTPSSETTVSFFLNNHDHLNLSVF